MRATRHGGSDGTSRGAAGIAVVVALAVVAAVAGGGCSRTPIDAASAVKQSDLRFLPGKTVGLAVVEVARFEDKAAIGRWLDDFAKQAGAGGLDRVRATLGPDALDRLDRIALALVPAAGSTQYVVLAEGRFEEQTVKNLTGGGGIVTLVEVGTAPDLSIMPLPKNHLALGPRAVLEQVRVLAAGGGGDQGLAGAPVMKVLSRVNPAKQIWGGIDYSVLAGLLEEGSRDGGGSPMAGFARSLRALAFQGTIDDGVQFDLIGLADGEPGAKTLADAARGLVAIARVGASQGANRAAEGSSGGAADPAVESAQAWRRFLDGVRIDQERDEIRVHGTLDGPMARSFAGAATRAVPGVGTN
ncbi:MAG TPA: hypothetical protein VFD06_10090 [Candidatus Polarisedimenticolia bacterium]|nr:hypothetical protein [Candidatus Polarisedimenticolia bacterium]